MAIKAPYLPYDRLKELAAEFLEKYHPSGEIPVPIEEIVEFEFGIDIIEIPGLHDLLDVDAFPTSDLTQIRVDQFVYRNRPTRYRFSLAHEIGHFVLHKDILGSLNFSTFEEWRNVVSNEIPDDEYAWIEWQAYVYAGLILVPPDNLLEVFSEMLEKAKGAGLSKDDITGDDNSKNTFEKLLAEPFEVSSAVIKKRMN